MILSCSNVCKAFGSDVVLDHVSFHIEDNEKALLEAKARLHIEDQEVKVETLKDKNKNTPEDDQK